MVTFSGKSVLKGVAIGKLYIFKKQEYTMEKDSFFNRQYWQNWILKCERMKWHPYLTRNTEVNSKWIQDLNVRTETVKLFEENTRGKLHNTGVGSGFMDMTSNA